MLLAQALPDDCMVLKKGACLDFPMEWPSFNHVCCIQLARTSDPKEYRSALAPLEDW